MSSIADALRAAAQPFDLRTTVQTLALTTADASVALDGGTYEAFVDGAVAVAVCCLGATTAALPPASPTAAALGWAVPPGAIGSFDAAPGAVLHARVLTGTGTLYLHRKVLGSA